MLSSNIIIPLSSFHESRVKIKNNDIAFIKYFDILQKVKKITNSELEQNISSKWSKQSTDNNNYKRKINCGDNSPEALSSKQFRSFINKITNSNVENLKKQIIDFKLEYINTYIKIVWDMAQRSVEYQDAYLIIIENFNYKIVKDEIIKLWLEYYDNKFWYPKENLLKDDYDDFCDFTKWKNRAINCIYMWIKLEKKEIIYDVVDSITEYIVNNIIEELESNTKGSLLIDALCEQLVITIKNRKPQDNELNKILNIDHSNFRPSTKFKFLDIKEILEKY